MRETRVFGYNKEWFGISESATIDEPVEQVMLTDILATVMFNKLDKSAFLAIFSVDKIVLNNINKCSIDLILLKESRLNGIMMSFSGCDKNKLIWNGEYLEGIKNVDGALCCQLKLEFSSASESSFKRTSL